MDTNRFISVSLVGVYLFGTLAVGVDLPAKPISLLVSSISTTSNNVTLVNTSGVPQAKDFDVRPAADTFRVVGFGGAK